MTRTFHPFVVITTLIPSVKTHYQGTQSLTVVPDRAALDRDTVLLFSGALLTVDNQE